MMGLMISAPACAASASCSADQPPHSGSSVTTSRMTLLSTSVAGTSASGQLHDLIGGESTRTAPAHVLDERTAALRAARAGGLLDAHGVAVDLEFHLGVRQQAEPVPDFERDGDLSLAGDPHLVLLLLVRVILRSFAVNAATRCSLVAIRARC